MTTDELKSGRIAGATRQNSSEDREVWVGWNKEKERWTAAAANGLNFQNYYDSTLDGLLSQLQADNWPIPIIEAETDQLLPAATTYP